MSIVQSRPTLPRTAENRVRAARPGRLAPNVDPIRVLRRHTLTIILAAFVGAGVGFAAHVLCSKYYPLYTSRVLFQVQPGLQSSTDIGTLDIASDDMVFRLAQTETYLLTSRGVIDVAMDNPEVRKTDWYQSYIVNGVLDREAAVDELEEYLAPSVVRGSNLFSLNWSSHEARDVQTVLNGVADAYISARKKQDEEIFRTNQDQFSRRLADDQKAVEDTVIEMAQYIKSAGMTVLENSSNSVTAYKIQELTRRLADSSRDLNLSQTSADMVSAKLRGQISPDPDDVLHAEQDNDVYQITQRVIQIQTDLSTLRETRRNPNDPMVQQLEAELRASEDTRQAKLDDMIKRNLTAEFKAVTSNVERLKGVIAELTSQIEQENVVLKDLAASQSNYEALRTRREFLEDMRKSDQELVNELELMRVRADAARVKLAQRANLPRQLSFPKLQIMGPLGVMLVVGLTVGIIFLRELMDQRVKTASDLAVLPGANVLGAIPEMEEDPTRTRKAELVVRANPNSVLAESYRQVWAPIMRSLDRLEHQTLLLCSGLPGAGTTTCASNLAASAAATGRRVVVIDANFRRPRLAEAMGVTGEGLGFGDMLTGAASLDQVIIDAGEGIHVIHAGTPTNRVFDRLNNGMFDRMVSDLRSQYDLIIFDAPPAVVAGDAMVLANKLDAAVLVVRANQEHRGLVARLIHQLSDARCDMLGVLLNRPRGTAGGYFKKNYEAMARYSANSST